MKLTDVVDTWLAHQRHQNCVVCQVKLKYEVIRSPNGVDHLRRKGKMNNAEFAPIAHIYDKYVMLWEPSLDAWERDVWSMVGYDECHNGRKINAYQSGFLAELDEHIQYREKIYKVKYGIRKPRGTNWFTRAAKRLFSG